VDFEDEEDIPVAELPFTWSDLVLALLLPPITGIGTITRLENMAETSILILISAPATGRKPCTRRWLLGMAASWQTATVQHERRE
jgi:hypothetical protein